MIAINYLSFEAFTEDLYGGSTHISAGFDE